MELIKIAGVCVICTIIVIILKSKSPAFALPIELAGICAVAFILIEKLKAVLNETENLFEMSGFLDDGYLTLLIKVLGIATVTQIASDICTDNENTALASNIELGGKIIILSMSMTLLKTLVSLAGGLLG